MQIPVPISVIIPAFNGARFLGAAIESVLAQTQPAEIIVVDDESPDGTAEVAARFGNRVEYVWQRNQGVSAARNTGLARASGDAVLFLDQDDRLTPSALEALRSRLEEEDGRAVVFGDCETVDVLGRSLRYWRRPDLAGAAPLAVTRRLFGGVGHPPGAFLIPTWAARQVGGFDSRFKYCQDMYLWMQLSTVLPFVHVPATVLRYTLHESNVSNNVKGMVTDMVDIRLAFLEWARARGLEVVTPEPTEVDLLEALSTRYFYTREWAKLDEALSLAAERGVISSRLRRFGRFRMLPEWVFSAQDRLTRARQ
ncbi:MAG: glycosyltransferase [Acidimicrobiia bacterium]|nr:glycosyltransferase [Acidimicrobiia bacterium]